MRPPSLTSAGRNAALTVGAIAVMSILSFAPWRSDQHPAQARDVLAQPKTENTTPVNPAFLSQSSQNESELEDAEQLEQFKEAMSYYQDKGLLPMTPKSQPVVPKSPGPSFFLGPLPEGGVVPDAATAVRLAEILLTARYGGADSAKQLPLEAHLVDNYYWDVYAKRKEDTEGSMTTTLGGVATIAIRRSDGAVLGIGKPK